jgi:hypothetical protein
MQKKLDAYIPADVYNEVGSRKLSHRLGYQESSTGGRIELDGRLEVDQWKVLLKKVPGVKRVIFHTKGSKHQQGNTGNHYQKHNFLVFSSAYPSSAGWEFELSRHPHSKDPHLRFTVTALFKNVGNRAKQLEAWRILCASVTGRELSPTMRALFGMPFRDVPGQAPHRCNIHEESATTHVYVQYVLHTRWYIFV